MHEDPLNGYSQERHIRPLPWIVLFFLGYSVNLILHELSHALAAFALQVPSTLFHSYADIDDTQASLSQRAILRTAGPVFNLVFAGLSWFLYKKYRDRSFDVLLLYLSLYGISFFLGNLSSISFVGDFNGVADLVGLPVSVRYGITILALSTLSLVMYLFAKELMKWTPPDIGPWRIIAELIILPVVAGTALVLVVYQPLPANTAMAWATTSVFWIFTAIGVFVHAKRPRNDARGLSFRWLDFVLAVVVVVTVRIMAQGVPFVP